MLCKIIMLNMLLIFVNMQKIYTFVDLNAANILTKIGSKHIDQHIYILHVDIQKYWLLLLNI